MYAVSSGQEERVRPFLEPPERPDIDLSRVDSAGKTPAEYAKSRGSLAIFHLLENHKGPTEPRSRLYMPAHSPFEDDDYDREVGVAGLSDCSLRPVTTVPGGSFAAVL
jgi:ankyrin repeat protein